MTGTIAADCQDNSGTIVLDDDAFEDRSSSISASASAESLIEDCPSDC